MNEEAVFPIGDTHYDAVYAQEAAMIDASELLATALETSGISRAELARRLGVSRGEITDRLKGERNITIRTLAETLHALGERLVLNSELPRTDPRSRDRGWRFPEKPTTPAPRGGAWIREESGHVR
ncbi:helix-turn-helix domain-containing protein [Microbacterium sp.]|uniref:helix-turn-helix domain-containing protein n=1 Tax=Microbacterium sp. TaxID=51671 RepID=UPI003A937C87